MVVGGVLGLGGGVAVLFCGEEDVGFAVDDECGVGVDECVDGEFVVFGAEVVVEYFEEYVFSSGFLGSSGEFDESVCHGDFGVGEGDVVVEGGHLGVGCFVVSVHGF